MIANIPADPSPWFETVPSAYVATLALLFSVVSLTVTFYQQYGKGPRISFLLGQQLKMFRGLNEQVGIVFGITMFNKGAQYGSVYRICGDLEHVPTQGRVSFEWNKFVETKNIAPSGKKFQPHDEFIGWVDTIAVQGRSAITRRIQFRSLGAFVLKPGTYRLTVNCYEGVSEKLAHTAYGEFDVSSPEVERYPETCVDPKTKISDQSLMFPLRRIG